MSTRPGIEHFEGLLEAALLTLALRRPVFHNEADFQQAFAWELHLRHPDAQLRLEVPPTPEADRPSERLDMLVQLDGVWLAVELKYPKAPFTYQPPDEPVPYGRRNANAADDDSYAIVRDMARTERWVAAGAASFGFTVVLTNLPRMWAPAAAGSTALDLEFRVSEGAEMTGLRTWNRLATPERRPKDNLTLSGIYRPQWKLYSELPGAIGKGLFRYCILRPV